MIDEPPYTTRLEGAVWDVNGVYRDLSLVTSCASGSFSKLE